MTPRKRLGEMLLDAGVIDETQLKAALGHQRQWGVRIGQALVDLKLATEHDIVGVLAQKYGFEVAHLDGLAPRALADALKLLPREFAQRNNVLPTAVDTGSITVAMSDPSNLAIMDEIRFRTGRKVKVCIGGDREIADAVGRFYPGEAPVEAIALDLEGDDSSAEALHDPFGGGSRDALEAFFSTSAESAGAAQLPAAQVAPPPHSARPDASPFSPGTGGAAPSPPLPQPVLQPPSAAHPAARTSAGSAPRPPAGQRTAPAPRAPAPPKAAAPVSPRSPTGKFPIPIAAPQPPAGDGAVGGAHGVPGGRPLTPGELSILDALERLAGGAHAEPEIVKPTQAMAAMIRLLLRKRVVTEQEFLDELSKK